MRALVALLLVCFLAGLAQAGPAEDAEAANAEGKRLHAAGDRERALARFRLAHRLHPEPRFLYNIAYVLDDLGRDAEAADAYAAHIAASGQDETVSYARGRLAALETVLGRVVLVGGAGRPITVDGKPAEGERLHVDPGKHTIACGDVTRTISAAAGLEIAVDLRPARAPRRWYRDPLGGALAGGGVALLGVSLAFYVASSDVGTAADYDGHDAAVERARTQRTVAQVSGAVGAALVVAGVVRWVLVANAREAPALTVITDGRGVAVCGSF